MNTLFDTPPSRPGNITQEQAAWLVGPITGRMRNIVYECIRLRREHGATNEEIASGTGLKLQTVCECGIVQERFFLV